MSSSWTVHRAQLVRKLAAVPGSSSPAKFAEPRLATTVRRAARAPVPGLVRSFSGSSSSAAPANSTYEGSITPRAQIPSEAHTSRRRGVAPPRAVVSSNEEVLEDSVMDDDFIPLPLSNQNLSLLYAFTTPPPLSALSALANRLASVTASTGVSCSLAQDLPLLEQCLIHESFWTGVSELAAPPMGTTRLYTHHHDTPLASGTTTYLHAHNGPLATLGNALLGALTSELLLSSFPHLPTRVTKAALTMYAGPKSLAAVASSWGVGPSRLELRLVGAEDKGKQTKGDRAYGHLVGGVGPGKANPVTFDNAAGMGLVRWNRRPTTSFKDSVLFEDALASVSRSIIGAIYQRHGFEATRTFVHAQFLSRLIPAPGSQQAPSAASSDIIPLLKFSSPNQVLSLTCESYQMPKTSHKLLKESGRLSSHPTFLSGVFSGERKLGEGFGSSIRMAEWRASEDALRRLYLGGKIGGGGLPSDAWTKKGNFNGIVVGDSEVNQESKERSMRLNRPKGLDNLDSSHEQVEEGVKSVLVEM